MSGRVGQYDSLIRFDGPKHILAAAVRGYPIDACPMFEFVRFKRTPEER